MNDSTRIYLDSNSTSPLHPTVLKTLVEALQTGYANPSSQHQEGRRARRTLDDARDAIGRLLGAQVDSLRADRIVLTGGGTEANNLAIFGLAGRSPGRIVVSAIEHPSVLGPAEALARQGFELCRIPADRHGVVDRDQFLARLTADTRCAALMLGNNETGVVQPVAELAARCRSLGVPLHVDAAQVVGKLPVDFRSLGAATMTVVPHKFYGPIGVAALIVEAGRSLEPLTWGGNQQDAFRPGTESVPLVLAFHAALELWQVESTRRPTALAELRDRFEQRLAQADSDLLVVGRDAPRLPHVSNLAFLGLDRQTLLLALDMAGVACSTGSACASGSSEPSPVLLAMGLPTPVVDSALRFSFHSRQTAADVDLASERILRVVNGLRRL